MTVEQFDPKKPSQASDSIAKKTTTLETPIKIIEEQLQSQEMAQQSSERAAKIGFVSLGCPKEP